MTNANAAPISVALVNSIRFLRRVVQRLLDIPISGTYLDLLNRTTVSAFKAPSVISTVSPGGGSFSLTKVKCIGVPEVVPLRLLAHVLRGRAQFHLMTDRFHFMPELTVCVGSVIK